MDYSDREYRYPVGRGHFESFRTGTFSPEDLQLSRLEDLEGWRVAEGDPDIRGWGIYNRQGDQIGKVESLLASPKTQSAYFLIAQVGGVLGMGGKHVLIPLDRVDFEHGEQRVVVDADREFIENAVEWRRDESIDYLAAYRYWEGRGYAETRERELTGVAGGEAPAVREHETSAAETRIPLREEEVRAERERHTGEVVVGKHVETEQRTVDVPVTHTEVEVERRPVRGEARRDFEGGISEGEVRVPVVEEETRIEKRPVVKEEIVVRQHPVTETERHTETVRREVPHVRREGDVDIETKGDIDVEK